MANDAPPEASSPDARWAFFRDVGVFQLKLGLDALRDILLSPISIAAAVADLLTGGNRPGRFFDGVIAIGRRTDVWINLFGTPPPKQRLLPADTSEPTVDALVGQIERLIVEQYERGGVTASAKDVIDRSLDRLTGGPRR